MKCTVLRTKCIHEYIKIDVDENNTKSAMKKALNIALLHPDNDWTSTDVDNYEYTVQTQLIP